MDANKLKEVQKLASDLSGNVAKLLDVQNSVISQLPPIYNDISKDMAQDMSDIQNHVKTQNFTKLNELLQKYANNNTK